MTRVSIVVPVWNRSRLLARCVESLCDQSTQDFELLVVDDGSNSVEKSKLRRLLEKTRQRNSFAVHLLEQQHRGVATARNLGVAHANGAFVAFLDSDDWWYPTKLERQLAHFERHRGEGLCFCDYEAWNDDGHGVLELDKLRRYRGPTTLESLYQRNFIGTSTVMVPRKLLVEVGNFASELERGSDYEMWLRLAAKAPLARIPEVLAGYRRHANSLTGLDRGQDRATHAAIVNYQTRGERSYAS